MKKSLIYIAAALCLTNCSSPIESISKSLELYLEDDSWEIFSFYNSNLENWSKLCIIEPYSTIDMQNELTGFDSPHIAPSTDRFVTLAFINKHEIVGHILHPRNMGDFITESGKCFDAVDSVFVKQKDSASNWKHIVHFGE